VIAIFTFSV